MLQNTSNLSAVLSLPTIETPPPSSEKTRESQATNSVQTEPGQKATNADGSLKDTFELSQEAQEIRSLQRRDQEVRTHEAAHAAAGGQYAGSPSFSYTKGADGRSYVTDGEVSIDMSAVPGDPDATLQKANQVRAAALAPAQPSSQDMKVAQKAQMMATKARQKLAEDVTVENPVATKSDAQDASATQEKSASAVDESAQPIAKLQHSAYLAYAKGVSEFISFTA